MKIGIMTFWWSGTNYGQILQCYALQKYLRDAGYDAYLIRLDWKKSIETIIKTPLLNKIIKAFNPITLYRFLRNRKRAYMVAREEHLRSFEIFRKKNINLSEKLYSCDELFINPPEADVYIVGSDQVWNFDYLPNADLIRAYFLNFGESSVKRIAYAASFGKEEVSTVTIEILSTLLEKFDYISVREKSGLNICKQCYIGNSEWVPDPTLLLDRDVYRMIYRNESFMKPRESYCVLYLIGNSTELSVQNIHDCTYSWAKRNNMNVIYITGNSQQDKYKRTCPTIPEWLYLIEYAEYVITDSFHGSVFSLLFNKKFGVVPRAGNTANKNSRLESLFQLFQMKKRYIISTDFSILDEYIDWQSVSNIFQNIKDTCKLREIIHLEK